VHDLAVRTRAAADFLGTNARLYQSIVSAALSKVSAGVIV
jgi:hypothetical protein